MAKYLEGHNDVVGGVIVRHRK
uniref:Uncharacterized protein n=1 Tax=Ignisphaera aggregans TaxID=334771 RepID=A0A7C4FFE4_9CREN